MQITRIGDYNRIYTNKKHMKLTATNKTSEQNFKGFYPTKKTNQKYVSNIINFIKDESIKKIAILAHRNPDGDAIGSMLSFKRIIKASIGKTADAYIINPLPNNLKFIDTKGEINVLKKQLNAFTKSDIDDKFANYDLVVGIDTAEKKLFDRYLYDNLLCKTKNVIKIDHHPIFKNAKIFDYQYGSINFVDDTKESASQLVMEFIKPLGLKPRKEFTDPISVGIITDTSQFQFAKSPSLYKDVSDLSKTSNMEKLINSVKEVDNKTFKTVISILNNDVKLTSDGKIAYFVLDAAKIDSNLHNLKNAVFTQISQIEGVDYNFCVIKNSKFPNYPLIASVRSKKKSIIAKMMELGGGGHRRACGLKSEGLPTNVFIEKIIGKINEIE